MSLFDSASLVVTPNGQKAGKLYSIKPTDGSGDLSVVRATSATRVDANGLVEIPRTNLLTYSEQFDNANWLKGNSTITANATTSPDGTTTADKLIPNNLAVLSSISNFARQAITKSASSVQYTYSVFAKQGGLNSIRLFSSSSIVTDNASATFLLVDGSISVSAVASGNFSGASASVFDYENGWYRCSLTFTTNSETTLTNRIIPTDSVLTVSDGILGIFIWGAQLEQGVSATEYIPTVASIRTKFAGITQDGSSASNIPRLDYTNGSCPSILVEPQRTNLVLRSEQFDNASWTKTDSTITANSSTAPDGTFTADSLIENTSTNVHRAFQTLAVTGTHTYSFYVKANGRQWIAIGAGNTSSFGALAYFDIENGVLGTVLVGSANIENAGNGWYRCSVTGIGNGGGTSFNLWLANANNSISYLGNGTSGIFVWGAQLEAGANATSYIPTTSASVTRNADVISKTGISSLINSVEGCFYVEAKSFVNGGSFRLFSLSDGTTNNRITIGWSSITNTLLTFMNLGGTIRVNNNITLFNQTLNNKVLFKWGDGNFKVFVNGVEKLSLTSVIMPTANLFNRLGFDIGSNSGNFEGNVNEVIVFPTQLTDDECINLTTI
jgi:hypothetical protein